MKPKDITGVPTARLLSNFGEILRELRRRKICRSENLPTGDLAEYLACQAFSLTPEPNANKGFDAKDRRGKRYQIKGRRITLNNPSRQLSALRDLGEDSFDFLIVILFDADYQVTDAYRFTIDSCRKVGRYVKRTNSHTVFANKSLIDAPGAKRITSEIVEAYKNA